ncbi:hypothetical protein ME798_00420 [Lactobacillus delbrueckii]|nr:hypothetical protein ME798_00420 [Lactobacillus delbrueckii]
MKQDVLYQILTTAEDCQTVSDIAKKLFLSQPYVSQVLSKAEKKYNVVLLERRSRPDPLRRLSQAAQRPDEDRTGPASLH